MGNKLNGFAQSIQHVRPGDPVQHWMKFIQLCCGGQKEDEQYQVAQQQFQTRTRRASIVGSTVASSDAGTKRMSIVGTTVGAEDAKTVLHSIEDEQ